MIATKCWKNILHLKNIKNSIKNKNNKTKIKIKIKQNQKNVNVHE